MGRFEERKMEEERERILIDNWDDEAPGGA